MDGIDSDRILISELTIDRYGDLMGLWRRTFGISVRDADSEEGTRGYLARNPGLSFIAAQGPKLIGCAMCGHDGRRGYLQHVIVDVAFRGRGIAQSLVARCLEKLAQAGIKKTHLDVMATNDSAIRYREHRGWRRRNDILRYSMICGSGPNA